MSAPARPRIPTPGDLARSKNAPNAAPAPTSAAETQHARAAEPVAEEVPPQRPLYEPRALTAEEAIAPGVLADTEYFRRTFRYAITCSSLPAHARLVAYDLLFRANHKSGRIGSAHQPDTEQLAKATGLTEMQAGVALRVLHSRGWLAYRPATTGPDGTATRRLYDLVIPALALEQARARRFLRQH
ncbi:hypothetical protein [Streptomyces canus]|uniref:hypothetical protein n=1 Tax=Streptomyces canus TaxID=58343 RepID=UPI003870166A|nr:hypothetical protein OH824_17680 [Streptomyces canus]